MSFAAVAGAVIVGGLGYMSSRNAARAQNRATDVAARQQDIAEEQYNTWRDNYLPFEQGLLDESKRFDSPEKIEQALGQTTADTGMAFANARESLGTRLASYGLDPSSGRYASAFSRLGGDEAKALVGNKNLTRSSIADQAFQRRYALAGLGRGLMSSGAAGMSSAAQTAQAQAGLAQNQAAAAAQGAGVIGNFAQQAINNWNRTPSFTTPGVQLVPATEIPMQPGGGS